MKATAQHIYFAILQILLFLTLMFFHENKNHKAQIREQQALIVTYSNKLDAAYITMMQYELNEMLKQQKPGPGMKIAPQQPSF